MRYFIKAIITIAIVIFSTNAMAIEPDKQDHLELSFLLGAGFYSVYEKFHSKRDAYLLTVATIMVIGGAKELFIDEKGDMQDMKYNLMGAMTGPFFSMILIKY